jgi:hypothetical protein
MLLKVVWQKWPWHQVEHENFHSGTSFLLGEPLSDISCGPEGSKVADHYRKDEGEMAGASFRAGNVSGP